MLPLASVLFCVSWITTGNESGGPSDVFGDSLDICGIIIYSMKLSPRSPLTKVLFYVITRALIVCRNGHQYMVLHAPPFTRERGIVTGCTFPIKGVLCKINAVTSTLPFTC